MTGKEFLKTALAEQIEIIGIGHDTKVPLPYHAFALDAIAIEFLGKSLNKNEPWNQNKSKEDFKNAIEKLFPIKYHPFGTFLYEELRCGMLHFFGPKSGVALSRKSEVDSSNHLQTSKDGKLILIFEDFHSDFKKAVEKLLTMPNEKLEKEFLNTSNEI